jgi:hypothetical protein
MSPANNATSRTRQAHAALPFRRTHSHGGDRGELEWVSRKCSASRRSSHSPGIRAQSIGTLELDASGGIALPDGRCPFWSGRLAGLAALGLGSTGGSASGRIIGDSSCWSRFRFWVSACCKRSSALWPSSWRRWDCWPGERAGGRAGAGRQRREESQRKSSIPVRLSDDEIQPVRLLRHQIMYS